MARRMTSAEAAQFRRWFPYLPTQSVWVLGGATPRYNCLAWALGYTDRWVWPWQTSLPSVSAMSAYIRQWGYVPGSPAAAAVYGTAASSIGHIGRFHVSSPTSKCGASLLITHLWGQLNYGTYGSVRQSYARRAAALAAEVFEEMPMIEATDQAGLPLLSQAELDQLTEMAAAVPPQNRVEFEAAYAQWKETLVGGSAACDSTGTRAVQSVEFVAAVAATRGAIPSLLARLTDPGEHVALHIAQQVLPQELIPIYEPDDPLVHEGEHARALTTVTNWLYL